MNHTIKLLICVAALWAAVVSVPQIFALEIPPPEELVQVEAVLSVDAAHPGSVVRGAVLAHVADGWHINAHQPSAPYLTATEVHFDETSGIRVGNVEYPQPVSVTFAFSETPLDVYEGSIACVFTATVPDDASLDERQIRGQFQYQACNDEVCLPPRSTTFMLRVPIIGYEHTSHSTHMEVFSRGTTSRGASSSMPMGVGLGSLSDQHFGPLAWLTLFVIGLALNLTPCVYPMLSVTVSIFHGQQDRRVWVAGSKAAVYVLGMASTYSVLGVAAALTGGIFGGVLQNRWTLVAISGLMVGLSLSMFGLYEIRVPARWTSKLGGGQSLTYAGIYGSGLVVGIFAAPCIGPPIVALLALVGAKGDPVFGFLSFFVLSLGLGAPYLVLGTCSGLMHRLPRSGMWMVWVKHFFGVLLLGVAAFYGCLAFRANWVGWVPPITLLLGGVYLGFIVQSGLKHDAFLRFQRLTGVALLVAGIVFTSQQLKAGLSWEVYAPERLTTAVTAHQPVILDFYANWCIPCHELDQTTFKDSTVIRALSGFVRLKVDLSQFDDPTSAALRERFGVVGVPTLVFLDSQGEEVASARVIGYLPPPTLLEKIRLVIDQH